MIKTTLVLLLGLSLTACAYPHRARIQYSYGSSYPYQYHTYQTPVYYAPQRPCVQQSWNHRGHVDPRIPLNGYGYAQRPNCKGTTYIIPNPW